MPPVHAAAGAVQTTSVYRLTLAPASALPLTLGVVVLAGEAGVDPLKVGRAGAAVSMVTLSSPADSVSIRVVGSTCEALIAWVPSVRAVAGACGGPP
jgi:hypothetical protein